MTRALPLSGLRVLDLTHIVAGPYATLLLADAGAEVIKIEPPTHGETSRLQAPFLTGADGRTASAYFFRLNRNKRSVTLDLKNPRGVELFKELVRRSAAVVENFTPGTTKRLGVDYETLRAVNPALVYASLSGFGQPDVLPTPYWDYPAMAVMIEAFSGLMDQSGEPDRPPNLVGFPVGDIFAGALAAFGLVAAVREADRTGVGRQVDVAMFDAAVSMNERALTHYSLTGEVHSRTKERSMIAPLDVFATRDGFVTIAAAIEKTWQQFCVAIDAQDLAGDPRYATGRTRSQHRQELKERIERWTRVRTSDEVMTQLLSHGVPAAPVRDVEQVFHDPGVEARQMLVAVDHPIVGPVKLVGSPVKMRDSSITPEPPPLLGADTDAALRELCGVDDAELAKLHREGVV